METSLRERSRARRRAAIERAALQLFAERGYDATTIADVAAAAHVAPRTVPMYFPAKLDLALAYSDAASRRMISMLEESGDSEPLIELLIRFVEHELFEECESLALHQAMLAKNPGLRNAHSAIGAESVRRTRVKLAKELGRDVDDFIVTLVGASVEGVIRALLDLDPARDNLRSLFDVAVRLLESWVRGAPPRTDRMNRA